MPITVERIADIETAISPLPTHEGPVFPQIPKTAEIVGIGRDRFKIKLGTVFSEGITLIKNAAEFVRNKSRGGRGPCSGCLSGTEQNHHFGSKCSRRGMGGLSLKPQAKSNTGKLTSIPLVGFPTNKLAA